MIIVIICLLHCDEEKKYILREKENKVEEKN